MNENFNRSFESTPLIKFQNNHFDFWSLSCSCLENFAILSKFKVLREALVFRSPSGSRHLNKLIQPARSTVRLDIWTGPCFCPVNTQSYRPRVIKTKKLKMILMESEFDYDQPDNYPMNQMDKNFHQKTHGTVNSSSFSWEKAVCQRRKQRVSAQDS